MIEFKNVKLNIKNVDIANDISFRIENKSTSLLLGSKNSGKSSILKMIAGIYKNYSGQILIDNVDIKNNSKVRIGIINDKSENDQEISVNEYLNFYAKIYNKFKKNAIQDYIDKMLKKFTLMSYKFSSIAQLDKESFKFIEMIRLLLDDSDIMLFDNLFFSDNIEYLERMYEFIKSLVGKKTLIFASRNTKYIENICDNIGLLENGELLIFDNKEAVYKYADIMSRIEVRIIGDTENAIKVLKDDSNVFNVTFDDESITFALNASSMDIHSKHIESNILKKLIDSGIQVYSYRKQEVRFEQLLKG